MARYFGEFTINEKLTKALDMDGWVIYRNPSIGLFAVNDALTFDIDLSCYSASQIADIDDFVKTAKDEIAKYIERYGWCADKAWRSMV